jgi:hypothetical protein
MDSMISLFNYFSIFYFFISQNSFYSLSVKFFRNLFIIPKIMFGLLLSFDINQIS